MLRFSFLFLESTFKRLSDDGFAREKALIVIGCTQAAALFVIVQIISLSGLERFRLDFGFGVAIALGLVILAIDYWIIWGRGGLDAYRKIYEHMRPAKKIMGGVIVVVVAITLVVACIVTAGMVARMDPGV
jgi:hypothetical protein